MSGLMIAAPASGSGKTTVTLGLLRALRERGIPVAPGKAGPDYIDPAFHAAASGTECLNYDPWAMRPGLVRDQAAGRSADGRQMLVVEAMMGLFDGAADGTGSAADLAALLSLPVVLVIDCARQSQSVAALAAGFRSFRADVSVAGVVLNRVASDRHEAMLRAALAGIDMPVFGALRRDEGLSLPERHLGLVQACEHPALEAFISRAAEQVAQRVDVDRLVALAGSGGGREAGAGVVRLPPPGSRVAVARDTAFAFCYEHLLFGWRRAGAQIRFFSPLADEAPPEDSDAVYLPGGYPELHAGRLAGADTFRRGIGDAIRRGAAVYGECGGYMVLGEALVDADGVSHRMIGALPLVTSFRERRRTLGYRRLRPRAGSPWQQPLTAHEFHRSSILSEGAGDRLFDATDATGAALGAVGLARGRVAGSFMHVVDLAGDHA